MEQSRQSGIAAMSGGVDSSVAAYLIRQSGCGLIGVTLRLRETDGRAADGEAEAKSAAEKLGFRHIVLDMTEAFRDEVLSPFAQGYRLGLTPNPCIACNRRIKFGRLLDAALGMGLDFLATGHYARVERAGSRILLKKAVDAGKDQSYMLYALSQSQLARVRFPLGGLRKAEVRAIAQEAGLPAADRRESQDLCFAPDGDYASFIESFSGEASLPGDFTDLSGNRLGTHKGLIRYTVGQRRGLGSAFPTRMYVCRKDAEQNCVVLGFERELYSGGAELENVVLSACDRLSGTQRLSVKLRYNQKERPAAVVQTDESHIRLTFDEPQRAVTPGQAAVIYDGDTVVGGGTIL